MLIGTAESNAPSANIDGPTNLQIDFIEDLKTPDQKKMSVEFSRQGIKNIGNTCYMNAVLQALRSSPELETAIKSYTGPEPAVKALGELYKDLEKGFSSSDPRFFWIAFCAKYKQFSEGLETGQLKQHDADEFMTCLLSHLSASRIHETELFEGKLITHRHCLETDLEEDSVSNDVFRKLECHIESGPSFLLPGIQISLKGQVEKHSNVLGRDALYSTDTKIEKLPYYLNVQFMRFYWKSASNVRSKIVKPVHFPMELDITELCTPELAERLKAVKAYDRAVEEKKSGMELHNKETLEKVLATPEEIVRNVPLTNQTGLYELTAVVTHIGMSAEGGHYIAWVKERDEWFKYDDEKVTQVAEKDVAKIDGSGGAQWHIAYIAIYKTKPRQTK